MTGQTLRSIIHPGKTYLLDIRQAPSALSRGKGEEMLGAIGRLIRLQYYRYSTVTGLYIMGNIESTVIQLTFFIVVFFLVRYTYAFLAQLCSGLLNAQLK